MPQMSPMMWFIFPFFMVVVVLVEVVTLYGELDEMEKVGLDLVSGLKDLEW